MNCETCQFGYFRPSDREPSDPIPCQSCMCNPSGISDGGDCIKGQGSGGQILGQCFCKANVIGLKCDICRQGFSNFSADNPDGCSSCSCNMAGTFNSMDTCNSDTGQCLCKENVRGLQCDTCKPGFTSLDIDNDDGCGPCSCNPLGSVSISGCDGITGACNCKPGVTGSRCDQCLSGFTGLSSTGCAQCSCNLDGSVDNVCDSISGQCICSQNVTGTNCDSCASGFYDISSGCLSCGCVTAGTVGGNISCDALSGQCDCKPNVEGRSCNACRSDFTNLQESNLDGCSACDCLNANTDPSGVLCNPSTGQCNCLSSALGLRCDQCQDGFYMTDTGCAACGCDTDGSNSSLCDHLSGSCSCQNSGITGRTCDSCLPGFFQFPRYEIIN